MTPFVFAVAFLRNSNYNDYVKRISYYPSQGVLVAGIHPYNGDRTPQLCQNYSCRLRVRKEIELATDGHVSFACEENCKILS